MSTSTVRVLNMRGQSVSSQSLEEDLRTNFLLDFVNPQRQEALISFRVEQFGGILFTFLVATGLTVGLVLYWVVALVGHTGLDSIILSACTFVFVIALSWFLAYVKKFHFRDAYVANRLTFTVLENFFMVTFSLILDFIVLTRVLTGACKSTSFLHIWHCNLAAPVRGMPIDSSICAIFVPLLCTMTLPLISSKVALLCYIVNNSFIYTLIGVYRATSAISILSICTFIALSIHYMYTYSQVLLFVYFVKTQTLQQQREEDAVLKAQEMRHVIGKVAHDLKTPLSSLTYGLESLKDTMDKVKRQPSSDARHPFSADKEASIRVQNQIKLSPTSSKSPLSPSNVSVQVLQDFKYALEGMQASHLLVMKILNRCIDYSTIANGLALVPRTAPVSIFQMIEVAIRWANMVYDNREVVLDRSDLHGATTMATDPVWLQDNLLCLVSNALKYSDSGIVKIRVIKGDFHAENLMNRSIVGYGESVWSSRRLKPRVSFREEPHLLIEPSASSQILSSRDQGDPKEASKSPKSIRSSFSSLPFSGIDYDLEQGLDGLAIVVEEDGSSDEEQKSAQQVFHGQMSFIGANLNSRSSSLEGVRFEVEDMGRAISSDIAAHLFLPSANGVERSVGGAGLGLFCLSERVKALGGHYGLISPLQRDVNGIQGNDYGNLFWFLLPYVPASATSSYDRQDMEKVLDSQLMQQREGEAGSLRSHVASAQDYLQFSTASRFGITSRDSENTRADVPVIYSSASSQRFSPPRLPSLKILIVDDSPLILKMLKATLQKRGHDVSVTTNGYEALVMIKQGWQEEDSLYTLRARGMQSSSGECTGEAKLTSQSTVMLQHQEATGNSSFSRSTKIFGDSARPGAYDVMLLDIQMPIIDGLQVMHEYQKMQAAFLEEKSSADAGTGFGASSGENGGGSLNYGLIIIAMSANNDPATMEAASKAGVDFFFAKPFNIESFQRVMKRFMPRIRR